MSNRTRIVTDDDVSDALEWLRENAKRMGEAKRQLMSAESLVKRTKAIIMREHAQLGATLGAQEREAIADPRTEAAEEREAHCAGQMEVLKAEKDYYAALIECWRTEQSTLRQMKI